MPTTKITIPEASIQRACDDFLALDGWRKLVTDPPHLRGLGVTEKGIADRLYIRYGYETAQRLGLSKWRCNCHGDLGCACSETLWIEWKSKTGKAAEHQVLWHEVERRRGALTLIAGKDFPKTIEGFQEWYQASGLTRRKI